ncbi:2-(3-amino-3-carboxypropyl)histidine synthase subunit 2 [[Candida] jaroonii]|uniref:2-(3-amino-3-carboxypropyl)histidine synthase subunit 2 n=1 Tax=[Candida] jaroonii TaxID=467808 RepID=A0ACA9Y9N3_9ASCO|nr:2-(3-amino-3-carboxypropyl)histidine synthase subunit 2 [[Candida] jaroonii]
MEAVAPSLSTYQDESTFTFDKVVEQEVSYKHLSRNPFDKNLLPELMRKYYNIDDIVDYIKSKPHCKRVTLQFPDHLVGDSTLVATEISKKLGKSEQQQVEIGCGGCGCNKESDKTCNNIKPKAEEDQSVWILADTSYSPCCVDEVAAEHIGGQMVIHFGDACLNPVDKLEVGYVFGKPDIDLDVVIEKFQASFSEQDQVILMADAPHSYILKNLKERLTQHNIAYGDISSQAFPRAKIIGYTPDPAPSFQLLNRSFHGLSDDSEETLGQYKLFHIGVPETPRLLKLTTIFESVVLYDAEAENTITGPFPNLMRRYKHMLMAKSAGTIGLLVNTLSLSNTKTLLNGLKEKIKTSGKKHYMFVVGKPNVAKLANFEAIDTWCILGCDQQGIIIDQYNEYYKPIITPFELLLALNEELSWSGKWETDFKKLVEDLGEEDNNEPAEYNDEPVFNPITGQLTSNSRPLRRQEYLQISNEGNDGNNTESNESSLVKKFSTDVVIRDTVSTAAISLQDRTWKGLGTDYDEEEYNSEGALVEEGTAGIARSYQFDVSNREE